VKPELGPVPAKWRRPGERSRGSDDYEDGILGESMGSDATEIERRIDRLAEAVLAKPPFSWAMTLGDLVLEAVCFVGTMPGWIGRRLLDVIRGR
jgi:hypothetical protein